MPPMHRRTLILTLAAGAVVSRALPAGAYRHASRDAMLEELTFDSTLETIDTTFITLDGTADTDVAHRF
jgi:hypothetical protein